MIDPHFSEPCLAPVTRTDEQKFWTTCPLAHPTEPAIAEHLFYIPPVLAGLFIAGVASHYLTTFIARQRRLHQITTQLQQIIALERMLSLTSHRRYKV